MRHFVHVENYEREREKREREREIERGVRHAAWRAKVKPSDAKY